MRYDGIVESILQGINENDTFPVLQLRHSEVQPFAADSEGQISILLGIFSAQSVHSAA